MGGCTGTGDDEASPGPTTTRAQAPAPPSTSTSTSSTTAAPATTVASRPTTTAANPSPEAQARTLFEAWTAGDRAAAGRVARPEAVAALFARPWQAADGWAFAECSGAAGSVICAWRRPAGQQLLLKVQTPTGGTVSEVQFQP